MNPPPRLNPNLTVRAERIGAERAPVLIIDSLLDEASARALVDAAAAARFGPPSRRLYPGLTAAGPKEAAQAISTGLRQVIAQAFSLGDSDLAGGGYDFAMVRCPPERLHPRQRIPHADAPDANLISITHYLNASPSGGMSFYRHRRTGFESITAVRVSAFEAEVTQELAAAPPPAAYIGGDTAQYERIASIPARFNRAVVCRADSLRAEDIEPLRDLDPDPRTGRLTVSMFLLFEPHTHPTRH